MARYLFLVFALLLPVSAAYGAELPPPLRTLIENFHAHRRVAIAYLRTENTMLASVEVDKMQAGWARDVDLVPKEILKDSRLQSALILTASSIAEIVELLNREDLRKARAALEDSAQQLKHWRQAAGYPMFSDCIEQASAAYEVFDRFRIAAPDLKISQVGEAVQRAATAAERAYEKCGEEAPEKIKADASFQRLLEGMLASLRQVPDAVRARDNAWLHRLLIEQRSFERLFAFNYG